ncbi:LmbU family transcriptional regulator [Streptomyces sp. NPDC059398]|uniref:LmbU family transcriptional regulator n=1 Tax=Streptomyces sp. NPDC059398 TaxID=3346820 RepID=UPI0036C623F4
MTTSTRGPVTAPDERRTLARIGSAAAPCPPTAGRHGGLPQGTPRAARPVASSRPYQAPRKDQILTTRVGLQFPKAVPFDVWQEAGVKIFHTADSFAWCLGDWLVYGQDRYGDRYRRAVDVAGLDYQTLRNYAWTARKFEMPRRHPQLSFQHHAEVASLDPAQQDLWLARAEENKWSKTELRRRLRAARGSSGPTPLTRLPELKVASETMERWRAAANRTGKPFDEWITAALDIAAHAPGTGRADAA